MSTYQRMYELHGTQWAAAKAMGIEQTTFSKRLRAERAGEAVRSRPTPRERALSASVTFDVLPQKHSSTGQLIERLARESHLKQQRAKAEKWFGVTLNDNKAIGLLWFGDPHLGVLTDWKQLKRDVAICNSTPGMYGANIGDVADNWVGSLMRVAAEQDISRRSERQLARWFLCEAGITWLVWLFGNHDEWWDGADFMRLMDIHNRVPMFDWSARFELRFPNKARVKVHAAHDFPGHSMWNNTHGPARAPRMLGDGADLYVCGHKHTWGIQQYEMPEAERCPMAIRVRGYKRGDPHARRLGYPEDRHGCSILTIIDPTADGPGRVTAYTDIAQGARVLTALRKANSTPNGGRNAKAKRKGKAKTGR